MPTVDCLGMNAGAERSDGEEDGGKAHEVMHACEIVSEEMRGERAAGGRFSTGGARTRCGR